MTAELARAGGPLAALGIAVLLLAPGRHTRLSGLAAWALGCLALAVYLAPHGHRSLLAAAGVLGLAVAAAVAVLFRRWPWLVAFAALLCVPARVPVKVGSTDTNLLIPIYGVVVAAALLFAWELLCGDRRVRELGPLGWPLALFVSWSGISLSWSQDLRQGSIELLFFFLPFALLALVLARLPWRREWLGALWLLLAALGVLFAAVGLYQYGTREIFWNPKLKVDNAYAPFYRVNSVFWDPSIYGRFLVVAILSSLVLVLHGAARRVVLVATCAIVAAWAGLLVSFSQSSFVALVAGVILAAWFAWRWRAGMLLGVLALAVLGAAVALPSVRHHSLNRASGGRSKLVSEGLQIAIHNPVQGVGIGAFKRAYAKRTHLRGRDPKAAASHDTPVTVAAETGAPGLLLLAWLLVTAFLLAFRGFRPTFEGRARLVFGITLAAIAVHSLFYNAFFEDPLAWGALGLLPLAATALAREPVSERERQGAARPPAALAAPQVGRSRAEAG